MGTAPTTPKKFTKIIFFVSLQRDVSLPKPFHALAMHCPIPKDQLQQQSYSPDLRKHVIYLHYSINCQIREITYLLNMSQHVVERTLRQWHNTGEVTPPGQGRSGKRAQSLDQEEVEVCIPYSSFHGLIT